MQETVLAESAMMVPETRQRLEAALSDLQSYVVSCDSHSIPADTRWHVLVTTLKQRTIGAQLCTAYCPTHCCKLRMCFCKLKLADAWSQKQALPAVCVLMVCSLLHWL